VEALLRGIDPLLDDFRLVVYTSYGIGEQLEVALQRYSNLDFPGGSRSQYLELARSHIRRVLGIGARVMMVDTGRLPKEGLIYKTSFRTTAPVTDHDSGSDV
jgi:hypothetical protein